MVGSLGAFETKGNALEYELIDHPLATVRRIRCVAWDALGQSVVVQATVGRDGGPEYSGTVLLTPPAALQLLLDLEECLSDKETEALPEQ